MPNIFLMTNCVDAQLSGDDGSTSGAGDWDTPGTTWPRALFDVDGVGEQKSWLMSPWQIPSTLQYRQWEHLPDKKKKEGKNITYSTFHRKVDGNNVIRPDFFHCSNLARDKKR